jgi:hypothetical protein
MNRKLLITVGLIWAAATLPLSPASAQKHKDGDSCRSAAQECDRTKNALWLCKPVVDPHKKAGDPTIYAWKSNGVCTNNLGPGEDMDKNAEKEKQAGEARRKANEKRAADEKAAEKKAAEEKAAREKAAADKAAKDKKDKDSKK